MNVVRANTENVSVLDNNFPLGKRIMDFFGSSFALLLLSPIFVMVGLSIYISDGRPIFFKQSRIGHRGKPFYIIKFRSMLKNAEEVLRKNPEIYKRYLDNDYKLPEGEDPRITKLGLFLRKTSLDELPQFWNVLRGEMSLVGPRPIVEEELVEYGDRQNDFLKMRPGITGIWQVSGRSNLKYPERAEVELGYYGKQSILNDIIILFKTLYCVFISKGAH